ncbi:MAG: RNA-binding S4 domain-containing protein [Bilifractor sp.]|jgi:ribosome-associated protein
MEQIRIRDEFIKLGQAMKLAGLVDEGFEAKNVIQEGLVEVNGEVETRRGKKLYPGDRFSYRGKEFEIVH